MIPCDCRSGVAPEAAAKADATGMAPKKSATDPRMTESSEGFGFKEAHFFGEFSERRPWPANAKTGAPAPHPIGLE